MMSRILAVAAAEFHIARRNLWVVMASLIMTLFALALTFAGAAPTGALGVDLLTVSVASMTTLSVYLAPLLALMMSFDAIAGENERGGLALLLTYPVSRGEILLGKFVAHLGTIALAMVIGFGAAGLAAGFAGGAGQESIVALLRLIATSILLGAVFLALGYALSALARSSTAAAGFAAGLWLVFVVLYDLGMLGAVVFDNGGVFTRSVFPWLLALNPADAFRLWNVSASENVALANGMTGAASALPVWAAPASLILWPVLAFFLARHAFRRVEP
ncbi:ABC transporter permease [Hoeflea prorocentri]|uniref:ABC transporter permease subunit n=1 Tax=Hoeflea prorocentri TaxID=1922333 RepID=A0A9X3UG93_9HYPH|nr:ABC transporter permease subunit [Hoeflea prorocentri]MCY6380182.1 ABC transporter permease subunit [Hoeflea prorocentri]MDA5397982.1 ABC transporter permease subunit [Hoeflea prorocentri]